MKSGKGFPTLLLHGNDGSGRFSEQVPCTLNTTIPFI